MFEDILGNKGKNEKVKETKDSIIRSLKYNVKKKQAMIDHLLKRITELERQLETYQTHTGI
jgi:prefoldin subunit 5